MAALHELAVEFSPVEYRVKWAEHPWERKRAYALREAVFCREQGLFERTDRDAIDTMAQLLVAVSCVAGLPDDVVGTVRIHAVERNVWWGSRLAVAPAHRTVAALGPTLIRLAVSSARALGCREFLAHVQCRHLGLFEHMHWRALKLESLHGRPHYLMRAKLERYPPCTTPTQGYVTLADASRADTRARTPA
jgi:putative N-acetyltransferase (TIGR04045 family)